MKPSLQRTLAITLGPHVVKFLELTNAQGRPTVIRAVVEPLTAPEQLSAVLQRLVPTVPRPPVRCIAALPRELAITRLVQLPTLNPAELSSMVALQAKTLLPYDVDNAIIEHVPLWRKEQTTTVLVVAVQRALVEQTLRAFSSVGLTEVELTLTTSGLLHWSAAVRQSTREGTVAVVELEATTTEVVIVTDGALRFSRSVPLAIGESATEAVLPRRWFEEVDRTLESYRQEGGDQAPTRFLLTGDPSCIERARQPLEAWFHLPVEVLETWQVLAAPPTLPPGAWSSVVGLALPARGLPTINLLPLSVRTSQARQHRQRQWVISAWLGLACALILVVLLRVEVQRVARVQQHLEQALATLGPEAHALSRQAHRIRQVESLLHERPDMLWLLRELDQHTPTTIGLTQFLYDRSQGLAIRGSAPAVGEVLTYLTTLEQSPAFRDLRLRYSTQRTTQAGLQVDFEVGGAVEAGRGEGTP